MSEITQTGRRSETGAGGREVPARAGAPTVESDASIGRGPGDPERDRGVAIRAHRANPAEAPRLAGLLAAAFQEDPVLSWCFPDRARRREILPGLFRTFVDAYLPLAETYTTDDDVAGAVCAPPRAEPDEAQLGALGEVAGEHAPRVAELDALISAEHPHEPHYYVLFLGTRPGLQSRGVGSALLGQLLDRCDRDGVPAYLDATSERNKPLYRRHGFEVVGEARLPEGPPFWRMWRDPR